MHNINNTSLEKSEDNEDIQYTEIYVWGGDHCGQLGLGQKYAGKCYPSPRVCSFNLVIKSVSCGEEHSAFVTLRGHIYTMGSNNEGRLGIGNRNIKQSSTPCLVEACVSYRCISTSCGWGHTVAVMDNGEAFSWGVGEYGALGQGTLENQWKPSKVFLDDKLFVGIAKVACGAKHTAFISEFGNAYVCGSGDAGQLGTGKRDYELKPIQLSIINDKVSQIACGIFHTMILTDKGKIYATGGNTFGQLGIGNKKNSNIPLRIKDLDRHNIIKIACGHHSAALTDKGEIFIWGSGIFGEYLSPIKFSQTNVIYKDIEVGGFFGAAIDDSGLIWTWGNNTSGELGIGDFESRKTPFPNIALQTKRVNSLSCGGSYVIALGKVKLKRDKKTELNYEDRRRNDSTTKKIDGYRKSRTPSRDHKELIKSYNTNEMDNYKKNTASGTSLDGKFERDTYETIKSRKAERSDRENQINFRENSADRYRNGNFRSNHGEYNNSRILRSTLDGYNRDMYSSNKSRHNSRGDDPNISQKYDSGDDSFGLDKNIPVRNQNYNSRMAKSDDQYVELLIKQKKVLEANLRQEKDEKKNLETNFHELRKKFYDLQEKAENSMQLKNKLENQIQRFEELKQICDEEIAKNEKKTLEMDEYIRQIEYLKDILTKKDRIIEGLETRTSEYESLFKQKNNEIETLSRNYLKQKEYDKQQLAASEEEINKLQHKIRELNNELERNKQQLHDFEKKRQQDNENKFKLEVEIVELGNQIKELSDRLDHNMNELEKEQEFRFELQNELVGYRNKNEQLTAMNKTLEGQNTELNHEIKQLRYALTKNEENEKMNAYKMAQENKLLQDGLYQKELEIQDLHDKIIALEQRITESEMKNNKLVDLLNQEINKQAQEFKQKTFNALVDSARKNANNIRKIIKLDQSPAENQQNAGSNSYILDSQLKDTSFTEHEDLKKNPESLPKNVESNQKKNKGNTSSGKPAEFNPKSLINQKPDYGYTTPFEYDQKPSSTGLPNSSNMVQYESGQMVLYQTNSKKLEELNNNNISGLTEHENSKGPLDIIDLHKRKLAESANKLMNLLDLKNDKIFTPTRTSPIKKPIEKQNTPELNNKTNSMNKNTIFANGMSGGNNNNNNDEIVYNEDNTDEDVKTEAYLNNLNEVKERLNMLQKNKAVLEDKMSNFEKKLKNISK